MDPVSMALMAQAGMGVAGSLFGRRKKYNPGAAGMEQLNRIPEYGYNAYNPFIQQGQEANQGLPQQYQQQAFDPAGYLHGMESQYQESPFMQYRKKQLMKSAGNTAAAGGFYGTENDVNNRSEMINALMGEDMQQYLQNVGGIQGRGLEGLESRVGRGFDASSNLADYLGGVGGARAAYSGMSAGHRGESLGNTWNSLSNLINIGVSKRKPGTGGAFGGGYLGDKG